jgi:hypothetical protein
MNILFKLSKMDLGSIKLDAAHALANLTFSKYRAAIVEDDVVEILFWLILEDCLQVRELVPCYEGIPSVAEN